MVISTKRPSEQDGNQTLQGAYNDVDFSITVNGYLVGKVGRKIDMVIGTDTIPNDMETYTFSEDGVTLFVYEIIYTDGTRDVFKSAERIS